MSKIELNQAEMAAMNFANHATGTASIKREALTTNDLELLMTIMSDADVAHQIKEKNSVQEGTECFYIFRIKQEGHIIVSAEDQYDPILSYSFEGNYSLENIPPMLIIIMDNWRCKINDIRETGEKASTEVTNWWNKLLGKGISVRSGYETKYLNEVIKPLIKTEWDQRDPYNYYCPSGYPAGCVAIAMAQLIRYYEWPKRGEGTHQYDDSSTPFWDFSYNKTDDESACPGLSIVNYKKKCKIMSNSVKIDYENTVYDYFHMPKSANLVKGLPLKEDQKWPATLVRHCGVAVNMDFWKSGSHPDLGKEGGVFNMDYMMGLDALHDYFRYNNAKQHKYYGDEWQENVVDSLNEYRPALILSYSIDISEAHVYLIDGYGYSKNTGKRYFHFNFGWGKGTDGYFLADNINDNWRYNRVHHISTDLKPLNNFCMINVTSNVGDFTSDPINVMPYGMTPAMLGYDKTIRIEHNTRYIDVLDPTSNTMEERVYVLDGYTFGNQFTKIEEGTNKIVLPASSLQKAKDLIFQFRPSSPFSINGVTYLATSYNTVEVYSIDCEICEIPEYVEFNGIQYRVTSIYKQLNLRANVKSLTANYISGELSLIIVIPTLEKIEMRSIEKLKPLMFSDYKYLKTAIFPKVSKIDHNAFANCPKLTEIDFANVRKVDDHAFMNCNKLESVTMNMATELGYQVFYNCTMLKTATFDRLNIIGKESFYNCESLESISIPSVTEIGEMAFMKCAKLSISVCNANKIGNNAFEKCNGLTNIKCPKLQELGSSAFISCSNLQSVEFPSGIRYSESAFKDCVNLTTITGDVLFCVENSAFKNCNLSTNLTLGNVGSYAFEKGINKDADVTLIFKSYCKELGAKAFEGCKGVKKMISYADVPPICCEDTFGGMSKEIPVCVPSKSLAQYKAAKGWKQFKNLQAIVVTVNGIYYRANDFMYMSVTGGDESYIMNFENTVAGISLPEETPKLQPIEVKPVEQSNATPRFNTTSRLNDRPFDTSSPLHPKEDTLTLQQCIYINNNVCVENTRFAVNAIEEGAFEGMDCYKTICIDCDSLTIGNNAFNCFSKNGEAILMKTNNPPKIEWNVFKKNKSESLKSIKLYVPSSAVKSYKNANVWNEFDIIGYSYVFSGSFQIDPDLSNQLDHELALSHIHDRDLNVINHLKDLLSNYLEDIPDLWVKHPEIDSIMKDIYDKVLNTPADYTFDNIRHISTTGQKSAIMKNALTSLQYVDFFSCANMINLNDFISVKGTKLSDIQTKIKKENTNFAKEIENIRNLGSQSFRISARVKDLIDVNLVLKGETGKRVAMKTKSSLSETSVMDQVRKERSVKTVKKVTLYNQLSEYEDNLAYSAQKFNDIIDSFAKPYYVCTKSQKNGDYEVHLGSCQHKPKSKNSIFLGFFISEQAAVEEAKKIYPSANGCSYCCPETNTDK